MLTEPPSTPEPMSAWFRSTQCDSIVAVSMTVTLPAPQFGTYNVVPFGEIAIPVGSASVGARSADRAGLVPGLSIRTTSRPARSTTNAADASALRTAAHGSRSASTNVAFVVAVAGLVTRSRFMSVISFEVRFATTATVPSADNTTPLPVVGMIRPPGVVPVLRPGVVGVGIGVGVRVGIGIGVGVRITAGVGRGLAVGRWVVLSVAGRCSDRQEQ